MPSIFSRSRTNSTPNKKQLLTVAEDSKALDEFGRIPSRLSNFASPSPTSKKDKKKAKEQEKRLRAISTRERSENDDENSPLNPFPDGTFLPLNLEPPTIIGDSDRPKWHDYGYLSYERHVVLGLEQVERLVEVVSEELTTRGGITTPFIFSTTALDISSSAIKRLIRSFLNTCQASSFAMEEAESKWREEARFAGLHELGMCLRWGLARVVRIAGGQEVRGLIPWEYYTDFRDSEAALGYPVAHFATFLPGLAPPLQSIIVIILTLLSRLTANSTTSGHTPPTLSPLFGPLLFGLGPATLAFHHTYVHYLRAVNATEHILLAFIRWQDSPALVGNDVPGGLSGGAAALGVPIRLKEWIKGYPSMLPFLQDSGKNTKPQPRRGARTVRVMSVRRNVRMYSSDLVKTCATWAHRTRTSSGGAENGLAVSKEWDRIAPPTLKLPPRYSDSFKKRMNMPPHFNPDVILGSPMISYPISNASSYASTTSTGTSTLGDKDYFGLGRNGREGEDRFRSLTDLKWVEFESMGFGGIEDEKKLEFDLTESARTERAAKRATLSWTDFSSSGFTRNDTPLSATLQFSSPVSKTISSWPAQNAELSKKLKKTQKTLPAFGWDTEPVIGSEEVIEEAFVDVFCDLIYGGGWMDLERNEEFDRDCNWALVEFKSLSPSRTTTSGGTDPRTATTLILFEEFVPLEYRQQLVVTSSTRRRLPSIFSTSNKSKTWKQAATLNGRPYVVGHVPRSPSYREMEFEGLLQGGNGTKVISLGAKPSVKGAPSRVLSTISSIAPDLSPSDQAPTISAPLYVPAPDPPKSEEMHSDSTMSPSTKRMSRFRLPGGIPVPSPGGSRKAGLVPAQYSHVDFDTRLASYSDDEYNGMMETEAIKQKRRESKDDAWVDILVGSQRRRMGGQDAEMNDSGRRGLHTRRSDPDMASKEVAQVLAAVRDSSLSPTSIHDVDVDEVETVPRMSEARTEEDTADYSTDHDHDPDEYDDESDEATHSALLMAKQRRMGYFDMHPERRLQAAHPVDDDPRMRLAYDEDSVEEHDNGGLVPNQVSQPSSRKLPTPPEPPAGNNAERKIDAAIPDEDITEDSIRNQKVAAPSKTAALIEMYRSRERGESPNKPPLHPVTTPPQPSRIPVRSGIEGKDPVLQGENATTPSKLSSVSDVGVVDMLQIPNVQTGPGRTSPERYVHGAPLHNVLEEDEEDA